jgi:hypothetical protein
MGLFVGASFGMMIFCHFLVVMLIDTVDLITVKRTSMLFRAVYG